jgi:hypothetical protein
MTSNPRARVPKYRRHKATNQAVVTLNGRDRYLGKYGTSASKEKYARLIVEWSSGPQALSQERSPANCARGSPAVKDLILEYMRHCLVYYQRSPSEMKADWLLKHIGLLK